jgi:hypothetical protein
MSAPTTLTSTTDLREYWRINGANWQSLIRLHLAIGDRLRALSSWCSS